MLNIRSIWPKIVWGELGGKELIWEDEQVVSILNNHLESLKIAHDTIKSLRDTANV